MDMSLIVALAVVLVIVIILFKTAVIVPQQNAYIVERLGKFSRKLDAGFHILIPFMERVAYKHTLKEQAVDIAEQICITKDNVQVGVDGVLYLQVLEPTQNGMGGEVPILVYDARNERTWAISGQGVAPASATVGRFAELGIDTIPPDGFLAATVPGALDAWCRLLEGFGTQHLRDVLAPARALAARGFDGYLCLELVKASVVAAPADFDLDRVLTHAQRDRDFVRHAATRCGMAISV